MRGGVRGQPRHKNAMRPRGSKGKIKGTHVVPARLGVVTGGVQARDKVCTRGVGREYPLITRRQELEKRLTLGLQLAGAAHPSLLKRLLLDGCGRGGLDGLARSATAAEEHATETVADRGTDGDTGSRGSHLSTRESGNKVSALACGRKRPHHEERTWPKRPGPWEGAAAAGTGAG